MRVLKKRYNRMPKGDKARFRNLMRKAVNERIEQETD